MRKLISILLLATFALPFLSALFALGETSESRLPACCRRNGAHHCMMSAEQMAQLEDGPHFTTIHTKCPIFPKTPPAAHHQKLVLSMSLGRPGVLPSKPTDRFPLRGWIRLALEGIHRKRGPPSVCHS